MSMLMKTVIMTSHHLFDEDEHEFYDSPISSFDKIHDFDRDGSLFLKQSPYLHEVVVRSVYT